MRLIDADAINFRCAYNGDCSADEESCKKCSDYVCDFEDVQKQPTAYDVEVVVAELEKLKEEYENHCVNGAWQRGAIDGARIALSKAISIVRGKE